MQATPQSPESKTTDWHHSRTLLQAMWQARYHYLLVIPSLIFVLIFSYYPVILGLVRAFYFWDGFVTEFVGFGNFQRLATDPGLPMSISNLWKYSVFNLLVTVTVPLLVAVMIYRLPHPRSQYWFRVLFVAPIVVPGVVYALLWRSFYSYEGLINRLLDLVGKHEWTRVWLGDPKTALAAIMFSGFPWVGGVTMLIYLAGLIGISNEIIDAAKVDGVGIFNRFTKIELPLVMGQVKLMIIMAVIGTIQGFGNILIMTEGGPGYSTFVPGLLMMFAATRYQRMGYASAIGLILFIIILILTIINLKYIRTSVEY